MNYKETRAMPVRMIAFGTVPHMTFSPYDPVIIPEMIPEHGASRVREAFNLFLGDLQHLKMHVLAKDCYCLPGTSQPSASHRSFCRLHGSSCLDSLKLAWPHPNGPYNDYRPSKGAMKGYASLVKARFHTGSTLV